MKKTSPTTYKVGSLGEFAAWTKRVICDPETTRGVPKKWFDSAATAARCRRSSFGRSNGKVVVAGGISPMLDAANGVKADIDARTGGTHRAGRRRACRAP